MIEVINSKIAGVFSFPDAKEPMKEIGVGGKLEYEREPLNPHDSNAIAIYLTTAKNERRIKVGYVPRDLAAKLKDRKIYSVRKGDTFDRMTIEAG